MRASEALSLAQHFFQRLDQFPAQSEVLRVQFLNGIDIFFGCILDSTENVHESLFESAGSVVMSAFVEIGRVKPDVDGNIILLALFVSVVAVFSAARANNKLGADGTGRVAVSRESQLAPLLRLPRVDVDFGRFVEVLLVLREVSSAD